MCGADRVGGSGHLVAEGSPPRVRSRPGRVRIPARRAGITSACAEQTLFFGTSPVLDTDHLRVCGADAFAAILSAVTAGSPPRVRSRPPRARTRPMRARITSACAEQTNSAAGYGCTRSDHLRVCGADLYVYIPMSVRSGSPPRVRSRHDDLEQVRENDGITSACAEQTWSPV